MFARHLTLRLKENLAKEFPVLFEKEILPLLRHCHGFVDELVLVTHERKEVVAISLWENREYAEAYVRELYPKVEKMVEKYTEGKTMVRNLDTEYST
ncbi:MAG: hypothetical protein WBQ59_09190, partial [Candidatus Acidiferrum sp.]